MNGRLMRWLLDLDSIPADATGLHLVWERPLPAWSWALIFLGAGFFAIWSYSRLSGNRLGRGLLAGARLVLLVLCVMLISGPSLKLPRETVEQDWLLMLVDRSASLTIADAERAGERESRDEQLNSILDANAETWDQLARDRHVVWLGFHRGLFDLAIERDDATPDAGVDTLEIDIGEAEGRRTRLGAAIDQAMQRAAARPVSAIIVFSDGRTSDPPDRRLVRRLQSDAVPVFVVPLGSPDPVGDLAVRQVDAPRRAFVRDKVPIQVKFDRLGRAGAEGTIVVRLVDEVTGEELDRREIAAGEELDEVTLTAQPKLAGEAVWRVDLETQRLDLIPENNSQVVNVELIDRPLRVLFVGGYPRWEYRYVKNLLIREESIDSSVMLISADRDFAQEGNQPITRLPRSPEEFAEFDVVILGDVPATFFAPEQLDLIRDHIARRGAGLLWIAGDRATPSSYAGTVLADLLPMRGSLALPPIGAPVNMTPTPLAERLGVLRLTSRGEVGWPRELANPRYGWSRLQYAQRIEPGRLKPTAEVLGETVDDFSGAPLPLVVHMRYGAGRTIYVATDEIWRWRYGRGELLPEQFWVQMIRMLGRERLAGSDDSAVLQVFPRRVALGQPVRIELELLDAQLAELERASISVVLETEDGEPVNELDLRRVDDAEGRYVAIYAPELTGSFSVRVVDPALAVERLMTPFEVYEPDDELRRPDTDHALLAALADQTGGRMLGPDDVPTLAEPGVLRNRSVRTLTPLTETIWDTPLAFALVLLVMTVEWIGRKVIRLA